MYSNSVMTLLTLTQTITMTERVFLAAIQRDRRTQGDSTSRWLQSRAHARASAETCLFCETINLCLCNKTRADKLPWNASIKGYFEESDDGVAAVNSH